MWFRRDLRVRDNPALRAALEENDEVIAVFVFDDRLLNGRHASGPRTQFLIECLEDLRERVPLVIRRGDPAVELPKLGDVVYCSADVSPYARARDERIGVDMRPYPGLGAVDDLVGE